MGDNEPRKVSLNRKFLADHATCHSSFPRRHPLADGGAPNELDTIPPGELTLGAIKASAKAEARPSRSAGRQRVR